jgi:hypothetical protein
MNGDVAAPPLAGGGGAPENPSRPDRFWSALKNEFDKAPDRAGLAENPEKLRYLQSWMLLRLLIGVLGLLLVPVTWLGSALLPDGQWALRDSLSAYYYSGMREFFTCALAAIGVFLAAYKAFEKSLENVITGVAGVAIVLVAFFPTSRPAEDTALKLTPLQSGLGETTVASIHDGSAFVFILFLAVISYLFGCHEAARGNPRDQQGPGGPGARFSGTFWKWLHWGCAGVIVLACLFFVVHTLGAGFGSWTDDHAVWLTEVVAVVAFATSWTCKGAELRKLARQA